MESLRVDVDAVAVDESIGRIDESSPDLEMEAEAVDDEEEIPMFSEPISMWDLESSASEDEAFSTVQGQDPGRRTDAAPEDADDTYSEDTSAFWAPVEYAAASVRGPEDQATEQHGA